MKTLAPATAINVTFVMRNVIEVQLVYYAYRQYRNSVRDFLQDENASSLSANTNG